MSLITVIFMVSMEGLATLMAVVSVLYTMALMTFLFAVMLGCLFWQFR